MKKYSFVFWCGYVSNEDGEQNETFIKPFEEGLKKLEKMKKEKK